MKGGIERALQLLDLLKAVPTWRKLMPRSRRPIRLDYLCRASTNFRAGLRD